MTTDTEALRVAARSIALAGINGWGNLCDAADTIDTLSAEKDRLTACLKKANISTEHFEREWYLRGDELDKPSRAMVVADIYEALTADRPYRAGMPVEKALAILEQERGDKLDGDSIDALAEAVSGRERETGAL